MTIPVVLASASPRRRELLRRLGIDPQVRPADVDESLQPDESAAAHVQRLAATKVVAVAARPDELVVAGDTAVVLHGQVLGKPADAADAARMLRRLSGRPHDVVTGVAVRRGEVTESGVATARVWFRPLDEVTIGWYVATGEPLDKAGAYGLQGAGGALVERIEGHDSTVVGLSLPLLVALAGRLGVRLLC